MDDGTAALLREEIGEDDVVTESRIELEVVGASDRVDRPDSAGDRTDPRLVPPQPALESRVEPLPVRALGLLVEMPAADVRDGRVGEVAHELAQRIRPPVRVRIREGEDLAGRRTHGAVLGSRLPAAWDSQEADSLVVRREGCD